MNLHQLLMAYVPSSSRHTSGGWQAFNCPCCVDNGEPRLDTKGRGGIKFETDLVSYHCFNCGFITSHRSGRILSQKFVRFMRLLGIPDSDIKRAQLDSIREKELVHGPTIYTHRKITSIPKFLDVELPEQAKPIREWIEEDTPPENAIYAASYMITRGIYDYVDGYWSPDPKFKKRVIFPFWQNDRIVGFTARDFTDNSSTKYITNSQPGYIYNIHKITERTSFLIVVEGAVDASAIDCAAILTNEASDEQVDYLNHYGGEVIVCPDNDRAGQKLALQAIENGWSVAFPEWENDIKDVADAVVRYGKLYTIRSIIESRVSNPTKIQVKLKLKE